MDLEVDAVAEKWIVQFYEALPFSLSVLDSKHVILI